MLLHFRGHEARKAKKAKEEQLALRRGASKVAREVRGFWGKLNKVSRRPCLPPCLPLPPPLSPPRETLKRKRVMFYRRIGCGLGAADGWFRRGQGRGFWTSLA